MKIHQIHIENFGKLHDFTLNFEDGINEINEKNGYGKTTLMAFIKSMLYGFPSTTSKNIQKNERLRYLPWNKQTYGGYMICEFEDKQYRIERTFSTKNSDDECSIYNLKTMEKLNIEDIGLHFLGLDSSSFERSVYIGGNMLETSANSVLIGKLTKLNASSQESISNYENAIKILDTKRAYYLKTGNRGAIYDKKEKISNLQRTLSEIKQSIEFSKKYDEEIKDLQKEEKGIIDKIKLIEENITIASKENEKQATRKHFNSLVSNKEKIMQEITKIENCCPNGIPSDEAIQICTEKLVEKNKQLALQEQSFRKMKDLEENQPILKDFKEQEKKAQMLIQNTSQVNKNNKPILFAIIGLGILFALAGLIFAPLINVILGIGFCIIGIFTICFSLWKLSKIKKQCSNITNNRKELQILLNLDKNYSTQDAQKALIKLESIYEIYNEEKENNIEFEKNINKLEQEINLFFSSFKNIPTDKNTALEVIKKYKIRYDDLNNELQSFIKQIEDFDTEKLDTPDIKFDLYTLNKQKTECNNELNEIRKLIIDKSNKKANEDIKADSLFEVNAELNKTYEELKLYEKTYSNIMFAYNYLKKAKLELGNRYITPTQNKLNELVELCPYLKPYSPITLKEDLTLMYEEQGKLRDEQTFSSGLLVSSSILVRFALASIIFDKEPCTIFLDDPFTSLDKENFNYIKQTISTLSKQYQIIYFTCAQSRSLITN